MGNYIYQMIHGHIIVNLAGRPCVLDTGSPFSIGYYPITLSNLEFEVQDSYLDVTCEYLSREIGMPIEGLIGADIISHFSMGIYPTEQMVQFGNSPAESAIVIPTDNFMDIPILRIGLEDKVLPTFFDTGAPLSYLLPEYLAGKEHDCVQEDFYPLIGNFLTKVYSQEIVVGGQTRSLRFGELPEDLHRIVEAGGAKGIIGTELLKHFGLCLSIRDRVMKLETPFNRAAA